LKEHLVHGSFDGIGSKLSPFPSARQGNYLLAIDSEKKELADDGRRTRANFDGGP
jgi:hypothetical protein